MNIGESIISIKDLKISFGDKQVLKGINLEVLGGQIIGYIGPNGGWEKYDSKNLIGFIR